MFKNPAVREPQSARDASPMTKLEFSAVLSFPKAMLPLLTKFLNPDAIEFEPVGTVFVLPRFTPSVSVTPEAIWQKTRVTANKVECDTSSMREPGMIGDMVRIFMVLAVLKRELVEMNVRFLGGVSMFQSGRRFMPCQ